MITQLILLVVVTQQLAAAALLAGRQNKDKIRETKTVIKITQLHSSAELHMHITSFCSKLFLFPKFPVKHLHKFALIALFVPTSRRTQKNIENGHYFKTYSFSQDSTKFFWCNSDLDKNAIGCWSSPSHPCLISSKSVVSYLKNV